jgi:hypothetical protein
MNPKRFTSPRYVAGLLLLSGVLILGIVQWSFLPILIQNGPVAGTAVLEVPAGHSSKFAASGIPSPRLTTRILAPYAEALENSPRFRSRWI